MRAFASLAALSLVVAAGLSSCAPTPGSGGYTGVPERQCFDADQLRNFRADRNQTLYIRDNRNQVFQLAASAGCNDLDSALGIALNPGTGGISRLCTGDWTGVAISGGLSAGSPCRARVEKRLTEDEIAALPDRVRP